MIPVFHRLREKRITISDYVASICRPAFYFVKCVQSLAHWPPTPQRP